MIGRNATSSPCKPLFSIPRCRDNGAPQRTPPTKLNAPTTPATAKSNHLTCPFFLVFCYLPLDCKFSNPTRLNPTRSTRPNPHIPPVRHLSIHVSLPPRLSSNRPQLSN